MGCRHPVRDGGASRGADEFGGRYADAPCGRANQFPDPLTRGFDRGAGDRLHGRTHDEMDEVVGICVLNGSTAGNAAIAQHDNPICDRKNLFEPV